MSVQLKIIKRIKQFPNGLRRKQTVKHVTQGKSIFIYILFLKKWNLEHTWFIFIPSLIKIKVQ